jgi:signal transduction histidine kinase
MVANAEVLRDAVPGHLNDRQMEFVTDILDSGESLVAFVNDIADLAKLEAGMMKVDARSVDLKPLLEEVVRATQAKGARPLGGAFRVHRPRVAPGGRRRRHRRANAREPAVQRHQARARAWGSETQRAARASRRHVVARD